MFNSKANMLGQCLQESSLKLELFFVLFWAFFSAPPHPPHATCSLRNNGISPVMTQVYFEFYQCFLCFMLNLFKCNYPCDVL